MTAKSEVILTSGNQLKWGGERVSWKMIEGTLVRKEKFGAVGARAVAGTEVRSSPGKFLKVKVTKVQWGQNPMARV
jgi:hypothetical protein